MKVLGARTVRARKLMALCRKHDVLERQILLLCRTFTDRELRQMGMACGGKA